MATEHIVDCSVTREQQFAGVPVAVDVELTEEEAEARTSGAAGVLRREREARRTAAAARLREHAKVNPHAMDLLILLGLE